MAQDVTSQNRTKQIELKEMIISYQVEAKAIRIEKIPSEENPSDHFTKNLTVAKFEKHRETIMGKPNNNQYNLHMAVIWLIFQLRSWISLASPASEISEG